MEKTTGVITMLDSHQNHHHSSITHTDTIDMTYKHISYPTIHNCYTHIPLVEVPTANMVLHVVLRNENILLLAFSPHLHAPTTTLNVCSA